MTLRRFTSWLFFKLLWLGLFVWLLWRVAPSLKELSPVRMAEGMATTVELVRMEQALESYRLLNNTLPTDFGRFLEENFSSRLKRVTVDSWGTPYRLEHYEDGYILRSAGPDRVYGTADDYILEHRFRMPSLAHSSVKILKIAARLSVWYYRFPAPMDSPAAFISCVSRTRTNWLFWTSTRTGSPLEISPSINRVARGFSISFIMVRSRGRAP